jgi:3',5'-cyclic AMP phosphodiesterase CpdA
MTAAKFRRASYGHSRHDMQTNITLPTATASATSLPSVCKRVLAVPDLVMVHHIVPVGWTGHGSDDRARADRSRT